MAIVTGSDFLIKAREHIGEKYVLGARAPMAVAQYGGPWDCAEFCSWVVYRVTGTLLGTMPKDDPVRADAWTGHWADDSRRFDCRIPVVDAIHTEGALLLRIKRGGRHGHIAFSDGKGGTVEAQSAAKGVTEARAAGRRWDTGVIVPGVVYVQSDDPEPIEPPARNILRERHPFMRGPRVRAAQERLAALGYPVGPVDGVYGGQTAHAAELFQRDKDLVVDGEIGPVTAAALGIDIF